MTAPHWSRPTFAPQITQFSEGRVQGRIPCSSILLCQAEPVWRVLRGSHGRCQSIQQHLAHVQLQLQAAQQRSSRGPQLGDEPAGCASREMGPSCKAP